MSPRTKPGKYGTLYLYEIEYTDDTDPSGFGTDHVRYWAYDPEHAIDKWYNSADGDCGWRLLTIACVPESNLMHQANRRTIPESLATVQP